jgi:hypothetical protein
VVLSTLGVLGSGLVVILMSPASATDDGFTGPLGMSLLNIHKVLSVAWVATTGTHTWPGWFPR